MALIQPAGKLGIRVKKPLHILLVEDNPNDAELLLSELRRAGFDPQWKRVETEADFLAEIKNSPDIILSDYSMPRFTGLRAAELLKESGLNIPFILISGTVGEDVAVDAMKHGATDYLLKDRIARLGQAVERALHEAQDQDKLKQAREELRSTHERLRHLLAHSPAVIYSLKVEGESVIPQMVSENITRLLGFSVEECTYDWWGIHLHPEDRDRALASLPETLAHGKLTIEYRLRHKDGNYVWLEDTRQLVRDAGGGPAEIVGVWTDLTERKRAQFELEQMHNQLLAVSRQAGMAEFATGVLHNVGNVLNSVNVASTCMADSLKRSKSADLARVVALMHQHEADLGAFFTHDPQGTQVPGYLGKLAERLTEEHATALKELGELQKNVEHIKNIINVQQDVAKMSRSPEVLALTDLVEDALNVNSIGLRRGGIQVSKEFEEVPPIMMEKHKVLQILVNLVRNAMQACEAAGGQEKRLTIRLSQEAGRVRIAVADNGSGILPEHLSRIFAHGFTTKKDGHGFGLHSAARAAKEMGGSLAVQSEGLGRGATFTLELPMKG